MAFSFRFESVLNVRRIRQDEVKAELGKLIGRREELQQKKKYVLSQIEVAMDDIRSEQTFRIADFKSRQHHLDNLRSLLGKTEKEIQDIDKEIDETKIRLAEAMKQVKVMERLRDRKKEEYLRLMDKKHQKFLDEIASQRHAR